MQKEKQDGGVTAGCLGFSQLLAVAGLHKPVYTHLYAHTPVYTHLSCTHTCVHAPVLMQTQHRGNKRQRYPYNLVFDPPVDFQTFVLYNIDNNHAAMAATT